MIRPPTGNRTDHNQFRRGVEPGEEDEMRVRNAALVLAVLCLFAWAAGSSAGAPQQATNPKTQATSYGAEAISIPRMLSYQGKLTDTLGVPVTDTNYSVTFSLYTVPSGGSAFWNETQTVRTKVGLFSTILGSVTPIESMPGAGTAYIGMADRS
jgi:hypothetical protein